MRERRWAVAALMLAPQAALAHALSPGTGGLAQLRAGLALAVTNPDLILPVLGLAVALGLWREGGLRAAWPHALAGTLLGLVAAPFAGPSAGLAAIGIGLVVAVCAALVPLGRIAAALPWLAGLVGFATVAAALEGHRFAEVSLAARAGLLLGIHGSLAGGAVLLRLSLAAMPHPATAMLWRVAASWIAAILVLYLAFGLRG